MQAAIDRVMQAYGMMVNLTLDEERNAREKVAAFLATADVEDENSLAVEGLKYLLSPSSPALIGMTRRDWARTIV